MNSGIGGAASGVILFGAHKANPAQGALICGMLGATLHWVATVCNLDRNFRRILISNGLLDPSALKTLEQDSDTVLMDSSSSNRNKDALQSYDEGSSWWDNWKEYMPIRRSTPEEIERYKSEQHKRRYGHDEST